MFYLGIDIGKNTHVASLMDDKAKVIFKAYSFSNTSDGAAGLMEKIQPYISELEIGMEATGHYWLSLYSFLAKQGLVIHVINPIQTDGWRKGTEIRKRKTDIIDSVLIADFVRYGEFLETSLADEDTMSLRNLTRFRNYLVSSIGDLKRKTICVLDQIFPEYSSVFSNVFGKTSKELLLQLNTPSDFEEITSSRLEELLSQVTYKKFAAKKINTISERAKVSFGITFCMESFSFQ
ncbi:TPA: IS110 family transposase, partial [Bacillus anthracis]|nr:IS110 family transposase [Bacillus anthracis]